MLVRAALAREASPSHFLCASKQDDPNLNPPEPPLCSRSNCDSAANHSFGTTGNALDGILASLAPGLQELQVSSCSRIFHAASLPSLRKLTSLQTLMLEGITYPLTSADLEPLASLPNLEVGLRFGSWFHAKKAAAARHPPPALRERLQQTSARACLQSVRISVEEGASEVHRAVRGSHLLTEFPAALLKLSGLTALDLNSKGGWHLAGQGNKA